MHIETDSGLLADMYVMGFASPYGEPEITLFTDRGDVVDFSREARDRLEESLIKPLKNGTYTLKSIENRIAAIRAEMEAIWNSPLPDDEKLRQIGSRKNEISLLQAGQFEFAKAGFTGTA